MNKEIIIVRHGRTEYNHKGIWQGSGVDAPLDEVGLAQREAFFEYYRNHGFDLIVHSPLLRARETVQPFKELGIRSIVRPEIREISWGIHEGKPHTGDSIREYQYVVNEWAKENYHIGFAGGESALDLQERISSFVQWMGTIEFERLLICSHGRAIRGLLCVMQNEPMREMEKYDHHNTGVFKAKRNGDQYHFEVLNNIDHLG